MATPSYPMDALHSFQRDLDRIALTRSEIDPDLLVHLDEADGLARLTFVRLQGRTVTAMAVFFAADPADGLLVFRGFFAVPEAYRNQGRAKDILSAALRQIEHGFARTEMTVIGVEVLVEAENVAGQKVAAAVISPDPVAVDRGGGRTALRYRASLRHTAH